MRWKNGTVKTDQMEMDYIEFGQGIKPLIMIPGLGDGLRTVKGMALTFSILYRKLASEYRVYVFSCRNNLKEGHTTRDMAADLCLAAENLGIQNAHIVGVSQGGMTAQWIAAEFPQLVDRLVLTVTADRLDEAQQHGIEDWIAMAREGRYGGIMKDTAERSYSEKKLKTYRLFYPLLGIVGKPKSLNRFLIMARACLEHDSRHVLSQIKCPVLILAGGQDKIVGAAAAERLSEGILGSQKHVYRELGHGAYEEAKDFQERILAFLGPSEK